jgi:hypothetical protein
MRSAAFLLVTIYLAAVPACFANANHAVSAVSAIHEGMHMASGAAMEIPLAHHSAMYRSLSSISLPTLLIILMVFAAFAAATTPLLRTHAPKMRTIPLASTSPPQRSSLALRLSLFETAPPFVA